MILISAMAKNRVIGSGAGMPWNVPEEYRHFLDTVDGETVLMGRRSWEIFGDDLTSAHNIVVSRSIRELAGATVVDDLCAAVELGRSYGRRLFSAGGAQIYAQTMPLADAMHLSFIKGEFEGDAWFPEIDDKIWKVTERRDHPRFEFVVYERRR